MFHAVIPILQRLATRLCANATDAEDLVQDTMERVLRKPLPADVERPTAWAVKVMQNLFVDRCRAAARTPQLDPIDDDHADFADCDDDGPPPPWSQMTIDDVWRALQEVDPMFREVYVLHSFEHWSYEQIAQRMQITTQTVGTRLTRVRERLRKILVKRVGAKS
jgi:RNA polymerase sigma-70 factor (ECF subfamily)